MSRVIAIFGVHVPDVLVARGLPGDLVTVIPPGFPTPRTPADVGQAERFTFLYAGRHPQRKGADLVIDSIRRLRRSGVHVRGIMVGDPSFLELVGEPGFEVHETATRRQLMEELFPQVPLHTPIYVG